MKRAWPLAAVAAAAVLLLLASWRTGPPNSAEIERRLLAHPEMAPYNRSPANVTLLDPGSLAKLAAAQPAVYGNVTGPGPFYRVEFSGALVLYDAGSDRILKVFNLFEGRLG